MIGGQPTSTWRLVQGWGFIFLGLAGLVLPIIPGIPFLLLGMAALSKRYHWAHRARRKARQLLLRARFWLRNFSLNFTF